MKKSTVISTGGIAAAIFASLCCIGPAVLAILGAGTIGLFSTFEKYRLLLIGITIILLGIGFYLTYRKKEVICEDGSCKIESTDKWNKLGIWAAVLIAGTAIAFPYFGGSLVPSAKASFKNQMFQSTSSAKVVLNIEGMDCRGCAAGIEKTLSQINGVKNAKVEFEQKKAIVEYTPVLVQPSALVEGVNQTGFKASLTEKGN